MALTVGTDAFATVAQVDAWAAASLSADGWAAAVDTRRETAIRQATRLFQTLVRWRGEPATADQELAFPRAGLTSPTTGSPSHTTVSRSRSSTRRRRLLMRCSSPTRPARRRINPRSSRLGRLPSPT